MSRLSIALLCFVLLGQAIIHATMASESVLPPTAPNRDRRTEQQPQQQQQQQQPNAPYRADTSGGSDIDLTALTPSLEQQLYQAKRLNRGDSVDYANLMLAEDALRYDMLAEPSSLLNQDRLVSAGDAGRSAANSWLNRVQVMNNLKRRGSNNNFLATNARHSRGLNYYNAHNSNSNSNNNNNNNLFGRDLASTDPIGSSILNDDQIRDDKDYAFVALPASSSSSSSSSSAPLSLPPSTTIIDNRESASRDSLWTSKILRDLLIAQEAQNRVRNLDQLTRAIARRRATSFGRAGGDDGQPENREKRRRCKVDPNLGVKNPSFCDTDAYFGATDYSMRDVWDSAGR